MRGVWNLLSVASMMVLPLALSCGPPSVTKPNVRDCPLDGRAQGTGPTTEAELRDLLEHVRERLFEELTLVRPLLAANPEVEGESSFLQANIEPSSALQPRLRRQYVVRYSPVLLNDPPSARGVAAILAHELRHIADYAALDTLQFAGFGLGYLLLDPAPYERQTDIWVVQLGCGEGLKDFRRWLYERLDTQSLEEKRRRYLTPDEIDDLMEAMNEE